MEQWLREVVDLHAKTFKTRYDLVPDIPKPAGVACEFGASPLAFRCSGVRRQDRQDTSTHWRLRSSCLPSSLRWQCYWLTWPATSVHWLNTGPCQASTTIAAQPCAYRRPVGVRVARLFNSADHVLVLSYFRRIAFLSKMKVLYGFVI